MSDTFDEVALNDQVRLHGKLFYRVAYQILRNPTSAEEACQQALCRAWQKRAMLHDPNALRAWLVRTVVHEALQMLRRSRIERKALERKAADNLQRRPHAREVGDDAVSGLEQRESVIVKVATLPDPEREIVVLRMLHGMTGNEVAEVLGLSAGEVSKRLHGGIEMLRAALVEADGLHSHKFSGRK